jgi:hypothetical protein
MVCLILLQFLLEYNCSTLIALVGINIVHVISDRVRLKTGEQSANHRKLAQLGCYLGFNVISCIWFDYRYRQQVMTAIMHC